jgi:phosphoglycerol transferase MdoB-like AlkP superfamily enzyme
MAASPTSNISAARFRRLRGSFRDKGYEARSPFTPFEGWFWNRENVYRHLGFDRFLAQDALPELEKRGRFASDEALIDQIMRIGDEKRRAALPVCRHPSGTRPL